MSNSRFSQTPTEPWGGGPEASAPSQPPARRTGRLVALIAIPVALVLAVVGFVWARGRSAPVAAPTLTNSAAPSASRSGQASATEPPKAPGPATTQSVLAYLKSNKFVCSDEGDQEVVSKFCTHFESAPAMAAYVGGRPDGSLGRLSLDVQMITPTAASAATSTWFIEQFVGDAAAASAITADIATGTDKKWATGTQGTVSYRGNSSGSVVLSVEDWYPADLEATVIATPVAQLSEYVISKGYACAPGDQPGSQKCQRAANGYTFVTLMIPDDSRDNTAYASVRVERAEPSADLATVVRNEAEMLLNGLGTQAKPWRAFIDASDQTVGDTQFIDGMLVDWLPGGEAEATSGALYLQPPCWRDFIEDC